MNAYQSKKQALVKISGFTMGEIGLASRLKAFDCVDFELMWRTLLSFGIPKYLVECLKDLYQNQTAEVERVVGRTGPPLSAKGRSSRLPTFTDAI